MSIPKFLADLAIIQKLSDLPNSTEGLTAEELKARFDAAGLAIQKFINEQLVPKITADNIPFSATNEIMAANIYDAIVNVQSQVKDAATGSIVNGSVTTEKLSSELLDRVFGGRPWVSIDTPGSKNTVAAGFPVGQLWLRPRFTVTNAAGTSWTGTGCSTEATETGFTITGTNTVAAVSAVQTLANLGIEGDRVFVLFDVLDKDPEIASMRVSFNGADDVDAMSGGVFEAVLLASGSLNIQFNVNWPSTSLANGSVTIANYTVVNTTRVLRQMSEAKDMEDWVGYLTALKPLKTHTEDAEVFIHASNGQWWSFGFETLAVSRGGTGLNSVESGALLVGSGTDAMRTLPPGTDGMILHMVSGQPQWVDPNEKISGNGYLRFSTGTYIGNEAERTVELGVKPQLLWLRGNPGSSYIGASSSHMMLDGDTASATVKDDEDNSYMSSVKLNGSALEFTCSKLMNKNNTPKYMNVSGSTYRWYAIY